MNSRTVRNFLMMLGFISIQAACVMQQGYNVTYNGFGVADPQRNEDIVNEFMRVRNIKNLSQGSKYDVPGTKPKTEEVKPVDISNVVVLDSTIPEGIEYVGGNIGVKPGYPAKVLGRFTLSRFNSTRAAFILESKYLAKIAGGNLVMAEFSNDGSQVYSVKGFVIQAENPETQKPAQPSDPAKEKRREL